MCHTRMYNALFLVISIVVGAIFAYLNHAGLATLEVLLLAGASFAGFALLLIVLAAQSPLNQNSGYNLCMCQKGLILTPAAALLLLIALIGLSLTVSGAVYAGIMTFLVTAATTYTLLALYSWISCLLSVCANVW